MRERCSAAHPNVAVAYFSSVSEEHDDVGLREGATNEIAHGILQVHLPQTERHELRGVLGQPSKQSLRTGQVEVPEPGENEHIAAELHRPIERDDDLLGGVHLHARKNARRQG